ncbi:hypothetical protein PITC_085830 [Penicillium italicum]|uniref:Integrase zinc-binding domain-containing protein n=1 Tax=Penicillium italicum TaxID=40296 RepID=A0A0A2KZT2_PENIT|nr:hypothetical protein PITC_085830 [Penicillium italicum]
MNGQSSQAIVSFYPHTKEAFLQYLRDKPSSRRVSRLDRESLLEWLMNPSKRPTSQTEFSRRNYVRKTFTWDMESRKLLAKPKDEGGYRVVILEENIADTVEWVHESNGHAGWDSTWKSINTSYYGILRSDVIFLLKQCQICACIPCKQPKVSRASSADKSSALEPRSIPDSEDTIEPDDVVWDPWTLADLPDERLQNGHLEDRIRLSTVQHTAARAEGSSRTGD